jgi:hypothetical protein
MLYNINSKCFHDTADNLVLTSLCYHKLNFPPTQTSPTMKCRQHVHMVEGMFIHCDVGCCGM